MDLVTYACAQGAQHIRAVRVGQVHVEEDGLGEFGAGYLQTLLTRVAIRSRNDLWRVNRRSMSSRLKRSSSM